MSTREIDHAYKRIGEKNSFRSQKFGKKKSTIDDYTGERIFLDKSKHPSNKVAQVDHIVTLHEVQKQFPDLSVRQQKYVANDSSNYAITNGKLNMHIKNRKMNHQVVIEQGTDISHKVLAEAKKGNLANATQMASDYVKTSSRMLKKEVHATTKMAVNGTKCRIENASCGIKNVAVKIMTSPEITLAKTIGNTAKSSAGGAVIGSTLCETVKSIKNKDSVEKYVGNVTGKGVQAAVSSGGGAIVAEAAGLAAIALGAGPVGWAATAIGTGIVATGIISEATNDMANDISSIVSDSVKKLQCAKA